MRAVTDEGSGCVISSASDAIAPLGDASRSSVFFPCTLMHVFFLALYIQPRLRTGLFFGMQLQLITQAQSLDLLFKQDTHAVNKNFVVQEPSGVCLRLRHMNIRCKNKHTLRGMM